jgi:pimeloyl-ACP methyl ester carboxylesterase
MAGERLQRHQTGPLSYLRGGSGPPLLLLHGIPGSSSSWQAVGTELSDRFDVVIPDLLGFGRSEPPEEDYYMEAQADALHTLLRALEIDRFYLGGHDFGGPVGLTLMDRAGEGLQVEGLALASTNVLTDPFVPLPLRAAGVPVLGPLVFWALAGTRLSLRFMHFAGARRGECSWERFREHLTPSAVDLTRRIFQRSLADLRSNYRRVEDQARRVSCPTLVIWGDGDPFFPVTAGERTRDLLPQAVLEVLPKTGHFVPEERPLEVAALIRNHFAAA